jgi:diketogulonate reductase-like aldo/keto reductase
MGRTDAVKCERREVTIFVPSWAVQRGTAFLTTSVTPDRIQENFELSKAMMMDCFVAIARRWRRPTAPRDDAG